MYAVSLKARAKINLSLDVIRKREDGYHDVAMIMQTVNLYDTIQIRKIKTPRIIIQTNFSWLPNDERNLAYKAAKLFFDATNICQGIVISLQKRIPVSAGLAGGSSDAAAVLVGLNKLFRTGFKKQELMKMGERLGADVPYCIMRGTALAEGIGEKLTKLTSLPPCYVVLAKPPISVPTPEVYKSLSLNEVKRKPNTKLLLKAIENEDLKTVCSNMINVLEEVTITKYPIIETIKEMMMEYGAMGSMMSGSGPTVFGIFDNREMARKACYRIKISGVAKEVFSVSTFYERQRG